MALADFTTYDDIRAALGVSKDEIEDSTLSLVVYEFGFASELEDADPTLTLAADFATVKAIAPEDRTPVQTRFYQSAVMFATYAVAKQLTASLPLFSPKDQSDGKATLSRYADSPYKETIREVKLQFERFKERLKEAQAAMKSTTATASVARVLFAKSTPSSDPVLGT